jgi:cytochrome c oxidase cbb3-type subunit 3
LAVIFAAIWLTGCERESRELRTDPPIASALNDVAVMPSGIGGAPPPVYAALNKPFVSNAFSIGQGKRLYHWFGCANCHGDGRGAFGPPLLDGWWQYGPDVVSIVVSIRDGRPGGMPAFGNSLTTDQIWQLAGYVKILGAYSVPYSAPARDDDIQTRPAENRAPAAILFEQLPQER